LLIKDSGAFLLEFKVVLHLGLVADQESIDVLIAITVKPVSRLVPHFDFIKASINELLLGFFWLVPNDEVCVRNVSSIFSAKAFGSFSWKGELPTVFRSTPNRKAGPRPSLQYSVALRNLHFRGGDDHHG
jgi:hypothetical protein